MSIAPEDPRNKEDNSGSTFEIQADETPRREGGEDAIGEKITSDSRLDETIIANTQGENQSVNPSAQ